MENQNIFSELHVDMCEKEQELKTQNEEIKKQNEEIKKQEQKIDNYESSFIYKIYTIYDGFYNFFSRIHF